MIGRTRLIAWAIAAVTILAIVVIAATVWDRMWSWLPWSDESRLERAEARADIAEADARSEGARATGEAETGRAIERHTIIVRAAERVAADAEIEARTATDANTPIDPDRARRLLDAQRGLCAVAPTICTEARPDPSDG
jgi:hypothetical protein